jgi:hypothetical protein
MNSKQHDATDEEQAGMYGHYSPVTVSDALGVILLGALAFILLLALLRSQGRNRELLASLAQQEHSA